MAAQGLFAVSATGGVAGPQAQRKQRRHAPGRSGHTRRGRRGRRQRRQTPPLGLNPWWRLGARRAATGAGGSARRSRRTCVRAHEQARSAARRFLAVFCAPTHFCTRPSARCAERRCGSPPPCGAACAARPSRGARSKHPPAARQARSRRRNACQRCPAAAAPRCAPAHPRRRATPRHTRAATHNHASARLRLRHTRASLSAHRVPRSASRRRPGPLLSLADASLTYSRHGGR